MLAIFLNYIIGGYQKHILFAWAAIWNTQSHAVPSKSAMQVPEFCILLYIILMFQYCYNLWSNNFMQK